MAPVARLRLAQSCGLDSSFTRQVGQRFDAKGTALWTLQLTLLPPKVFGCSYGGMGFFFQPTLGLRSAEASKTMGGAWQRLLKRQGAPLVLEPLEAASTELIGVGYDTTSEDVWQVRAPAEPSTSPWPSLKRGPCPSSCARSRAG